MSMNTRQIELSQRLRNIRQRQEKELETEAQALAVEYQLSILQARSLLHMAIENPSELPEHITRVVR